MTSPDEPIPFRYYCRVRWAVGLVGAALLATSPGCSTETKIEVVPVSGTVTLEGAALPGVVVTFYPVTESPKGLPCARGTTDAAGKYQLADLDGNPGAAIGQSRVVVNLPPRERSDERGTGRPSRKEIGPTIPIQYTVAADTPLIVEVKAGGPQTIDLVLKK